MQFSIQLTHGKEYAAVGEPRAIDVPHPALAGHAAKAFLFDAQAEGGAERPDGYSVYDEHGEWIERYRVGET